MYFFNLSASADHLACCTTQVPHLCVIAGSDSLCWMDAALTFLVFLGCIRCNMPQFS